METKTSIKIFSLTIYFLSLFLISTIVSASGENKLTVKSIHRISHPAYGMGNYAWTYRNPFNVDYSRVIMYESGVIAQAPNGDILIHPDFDVSGEIRNEGRGSIWGCLTSNCVTQASVYHTTINSTLQDLNLDNATGGSTENRKLVAWDNNTVQIPYQFARNVYWSPFAGEPNILYAICSYNSGVCSGNQYKLVIYNVDTGVLTPIISYYNASYDLTRTQIAGFTDTGSPSGTKEIIIDLEADGGGEGGGNGYRVFLDHDNNFASPTKTLEGTARSCNTKTSWYPPQQGVHGDWSPDGAYYVIYGITQTALKNDYSGDECYSYPSTPLTANWWRDTESFAYGISHISWNLGGSNDWYIGSNWNEPSSSCESCSPSGSPYYPHLTTTSRVHQIFLNRTIADANPGQHDHFISGLFTHNPLIIRTTAGMWGFDKNDAGKVVNYHGIPSATISPDGQHLYFFGTNGKYARDDVGMCAWLQTHQSNVPDYSITEDKCDAIGNNWEGIGTYIAVLAPASSGNDTTPPSTPTDLSATSVSSSQINLSWNASTDNVGVTGYKIYRDGSLVSTVNSPQLTYQDTGLTPSTTYTYTISAYDVAGNASAQSASASATTQAASTVYLSDLIWISATNGWGPVEKDKSNGDKAAGDGKTITLNGTTYAKGLGVHAASDVQYSLAGAYSTFMADIGMDDEVGTNGSVIFQVFADGVKLYDSGTMTGSTPTKQANVDITGKNTLQLVVANAGDGITSDHADWANARIIYADTTSPASPSGLSVN